MIDLQTTTLIHDIDAERMVLGSLLSNTGAINEVREHLTPECFYDQKHQEVYRAIADVDSRGENVNCITVAASLAKTAPIVTITDLAALMQMFTTGELTFYALRLKELLIRRKMWELGQYLIQSGATESEDVADVQEEARGRLTSMFASASVDVHTLTEAFSQLRTQIDRKT